jgi:hypothetical protein
MNTFVACGLGLFVHGEQRLRHADEHGEIAAWLELVVLGAADLRLRQRQHLDRRLRVGKALEATLAQWIERDNRHAALTDFLQLMQHPRAVDPDVLAEEHHAVGMVGMFDLHRADRNSNGLWQSD